MKKVYCFYLALIIGSAVLALVSAQTPILTTPFPTNLATMPGKWAWRVQSSSNLVNWTDEPFYTNADGWWYVNKMGRPNTFFRFYGVQLP